jgi:hypothetical protein
MLIQGPFMTPNDKAIQDPINSNGGFMQNCFKSTTQVNDTIIVAVVTESTVANMAVTDDGSSSNAYAIPSGASEVSGGHTLAIFTATVAHASRCLSVTFTTDTGAIDDQMTMWEYSNVGSVDGTPCATHVTTGTSVACGSAITTTVSGDLVLAVTSVTTFGTTPTGSMHFTAQTGASWNLSTNDGTDWSASQTEIQSASGAVTPAITSSTAVSSANIVGIAFKPTSTGGNVPSGPYLLSMQHQNNWGFSTAPTATSETLYFPCPASVTGTVLWLLLGNVDTTTVTGVTDSNSNTWTGLTRVDSTGDGFSIQWYHTALNPTCSGSEALTLTYGANPSALLPLWDFFIVTGAASGYDSTEGQKSTNTSCASPTAFTGPTVTPTSFPALVLAYGNQDFNTGQSTNVGQFLTAVEVCPNSGNIGCGGNGTSTNYAYVGSGLEQDAFIVVDNLASGSAAFSWTAANTQSQNIGACFSAALAVE